MSEYEEEERISRRRTPKTNNAEYTDNLAVKGDGIRAEKDRYGEWEGDNEDDDEYNPSEEEW